MRAMVLNAQRQRMQEKELADPVPGPEQLLIHVSACGVCRTDLHIVDGELTEPELPIIPGRNSPGNWEQHGQEHLTRHPRDLSIRQLFLPRQVSWYRSH